MAFGFALCATVVFAQMPAKKETRAMIGNKSLEAVAMPTDDVQEQATFKGSIFSKAVTLRAVETFGGAASATTYQVGVVDNNYPYPHVQPNNIAESHTSHWFRVADTTSEACAEATNVASILFGENGSFTSLDGFNSNSPMDGLMACSMQDQFAQWGGSGDNGAYNTYIEFPVFSTVAPEGDTISVIDVELYQYYRCFNRDRCNIDYSIDGGATWDSVEFNINNVDVTANKSLLGWKRVTLPLRTLDKESVKIRVRYSCNDNSGGDQPYGYFWLIDDVSVIGQNPTVANRMKISEVNYVHGAYHTVPQGMDVNAIAWYSYFTNNGGFDQTGITSYIKTTDGAVVATSSTPDTAVNAVENAEAGKYLGENGYSVIDNYENVNDRSDDGSIIGFGRQGTSATLPHATAGEYAIYSQFTTASGINYTFDTIGYRVEDADEIGTYVWGRDNGILVQNSQWTYGLTPDGRFLTEEAGFNLPGYAPMMSYTTGNVPEGWVIRGIEFVGNTNADWALDVEAGMVQIYPLLYWDSIYSGSDGNYYSFRGVSTGAGVHTVTLDEMNYDDAAPYMEYGEYQTIRIMFPEQPELKPKTAYRIGYSMQSNANFSVASDRNRYVENNQYVYYSDNADLAPYAVRFGNGAGTNVIVDNADAGTLGWVANSAGSNVPMMRMLVGPKRNLPTHNISISWTGAELGLGEETGIVDSDGITMFENGARDVVTEGSTVDYYICIAPDSIQSIEVADIVVDGNSVIDQCEYNSAGGYYTYTFNNVVADHTLTANFIKGIGINSIENNVKVSLQPNPATAQTQLTVEGVNGEISLSLVDMSGRVIAEEVIDANEVKTINVSGLAKGTYFVRLTNSNFSKVEKLIVR